MKKIPFQKLPLFFAKHERIAGIMVQENAVNALLLSPKTKGGYQVVYHREIPLEKDTISRGEIKNTNALLKAVNKLKDLSSHTQDIIISLPNTLSYNTVLAIPQRTPQKQEAGIVKSQLEAHSPIPLEESFYDWESLPRRIGTKRDVLVSVGTKNKILPYVLLFEELGFNVIAVETQIHSIRRVLDPSPHIFLIIIVLDWGVETHLVKNGVIVFEHSVPLEKLMMETFTGPEDFITHEVNRVVEFYLSEHAQEKIEYFSIVQESTKDVQEEKLKQLLQEKLGLPSKDLKSSTTILNTVPREISSSSSQLSLVGAALRGLVPRRKDVFISLATVGTEELWRQTKLIALGRILSDFVTIVSVAFVLTFGGTWAYLNFFFQKSVQEKLRTQQASTSIAQTHQAIRELEENIEVYNGKVANLNSLYAKIPDWTIPIGDIMARVQPGISIYTIEMGISGAQARISGKAETVWDLIDFQNVLAFSGLFTVDFKTPLSFFELKRDISFGYTLPFKDLTAIYPFHFYESLKK